MKYFLPLIFLLSCYDQPAKLTPPMHDQQIETHDNSAADLHAPYNTGKDTARLNRVIEELSQFPEVQRLTQQIDKNGNGKHGVSFMVKDEFEGDSTLYHFEVGDNSHQDRCVNVYDFVMLKKTGEIKAYDHLSGKLMGLEEWRKR